ncbi:hypothetical protein Y032_0394g639 [Ancylostoma ceylanicum]|uniref:Reverse transcriptase domain-containing protein n=1 Tax=Ancylostoma ceylanicum TaxID=53326 RepID=A0A016RRX8_9BILA|nr:hypothetical protein Y032_0394g639 [Ancylostoma ceylanicum]
MPRLLVRNIGGVGFLINSTVQHLVDYHEFIGPRLAILRLRTKEQGTISIINGYAPTSAATDEERERFYQLLEETVREEKSYYKFVVGDFNAIVGTNCNGDWRLGPHGCATRNENGERLLDFLSACRLFHGNSMFEKPAKRRWTWESPNGLTRSEIDHILTNRRWSLFDVSVLPSFDTGSDHRLIRAKITLNKKNFKRDTHRPAPHKIPTFKSADLESAIESNTWTLFEDPTEDYDHLVRGLLKCADASRLSQPTTIPRLNAHATALLEKRKAVKLDQNATHLEKVITGNACRVAVKESLRDYRRTKLLEAAETKSSIKRCKRDLNDQRNVMAALKDKEGKMQSSRRAMENIVQQFYTELFRSSTLVPRCPLPPPEDLLPILESEVGQAIKSMKKGTAPGPDNIPADLLRAGSTALHSVLARHFNHYLRKGMIPDQWKESKTILLFKKGQREDIANYRPISLLSVVYKTFTKILLNRMERILDDYQPVEQAGFRKNFSCMDNIQAVTQLIERSREYHLPLVLVFVDYKKAFDSVETNAVLNALAHAGVPSVYIRLLEQCFSDNSTIIQLFDRKLKIPIERGVRQGDTISPKLFTAALQYAMSELDWEDKGYSIDGKKISNLRFADDIVLVANSTAEMETMVNELNVAGLKIGLEMNMSKTQLMVNQWCDAGEVNLAGKTLQRVDSYVYLGRELNMRNNIAPEITRRRRAAWAAFGSIREVTDQIKDPALRASIFNASVLPAMCYATETWPDNETIAKAMRTTHRALERCLLKTSRYQQWHQGLRSTELREKSQLKDPLQYMQRMKHRWAGHLLRRNDDRWSLRVTEWLPRNKTRPLGRPPTRWADSFTKYFRQRGLPHWMQVARNRAVWRSCGPR